MCLQGFRKLPTKTASLKYGEANLSTAPIKPHNKVTISTASGWLKGVLQLSDINIDIFNAHSATSASTSKAFLKGASIKEIMKTACWSNESTFQTFYKRKVVESNSFQSNVIEVVEIMTFSHNKSVRTHIRSGRDFMKWNWGLCNGAQRRQCNLGFINKIEPNDLIYPLTPPLDLFVFALGGRKQIHGDGRGRSRGRGH